jgi:hypothetical protein
VAAFLRQRKSLDRPQTIIENGRTPGTVSELIESAADQKQWNVDEPGVMIKSPPFGLVFLPVSALADDPITFVARNEI